MGVVEIQKINALARELMKHGIARTSNEALLKAEQVLKQNSVSSITAAITSSTNLAKQESAHETAHLSNEVLAELNMDMRSLGVRLEAIAREVLGMKDEIKNMNGNLSEVNKQIMRMAIQHLQPSTVPSVASSSSQHQPEHLVQMHETLDVAQQSHQPATQQTLVREAPKVEQARVTARSKEEFTPEDVAIEKIFYFGK